LVVVCDQDGIAETESFDRDCNLLDLSPAVSPGVSWIGFKRLNGYPLDGWIELAHVGHQKQKEPNLPPKN
jgi:hypothetical protein